MLDPRLDLGPCLIAAAGGVGGGRGECATSTSREIPGCWSRSARRSRTTSPWRKRQIEALAGQPVRVLVTVGPDHDPAELGQVAANSVVERFVSHSAVLERSVPLVSHAGHGSVRKALWHGRPMVLVPSGPDQPGVAARAERARRRGDRRARAGVRHDGASAIDAVLGDPVFADRATRESERLRLTDPALAAADPLEETLRDGALPTSWAIAGGSLERDRR